MGNLYLLDKLQQMKAVLTALGLMLFQCVAAQDATTSEMSRRAPSLIVVNGIPFLNSKFVSLVEGTPYFQEEWMKGVLIAYTGQVYKNLQLKLDLLENEVHYQNEKGEELISITPIRQVLLANAAGDSFVFVHSSTLPVTATPLKVGWYQHLYEGPASLYKAYEKSMFETRPYNSASAEQHIKTKESYLLLYNNSYIELRRIKDAPTILANKKAELESFLNNNDDKKRTLDQRFTSLVEYYNSILADKK